MRTVRILLAAAIASTAVAGAGAGCGSKGSSAPAVEPGKPAGDVREVTGTVTAKRGEEAPRTLAVGDEVSGDDVITTGADSSVVIELRHNGVRWSLGAGQEKQVALSLAWKAPKGGGGSIDERSTAAGRHAEREAADTAESAVASADTGGGGSGSGGAAPGAGSGSSAVMAQPTPAPTAAAPPPPEPVSDEESGGTGERMALEEGKMGKRDSERAEGQYKMKDAPMEAPKPAPVAQAGISIEVKSASGGRDVDAVKSALTGRMRPLIACWQEVVDSGATAGGAVTFAFVVDEDGAVGNVDAKADSAVKAAVGCLERELKATAFAESGATSKVTVTLKLGL
jgi:hypothetical protein